jgi:hypothetical protein
MKEDKWVVHIITQTIFGERRWKLGEFKSKVKGFNTFFARCGNEGMKRNQIEFTKKEKE